MTSYLEGGWYGRKGRTRLRTEVVDGAMDVAGMLLRAGVPSRRLLRLALKVRSLVVIADPLMLGTPRFGERDRELVNQRLALQTDGYPELQGFVADCIEHVSGAPDMTAFYLHLVHIARMMQLLSHAVGSGLGALRLNLAGSAGDTPLRHRHVTPRAAKKPAANALRRRAEPTRRKKKSSKNAAKKKRPAAKKKTSKKK